MYDVPVDRQLAETVLATVPHAVIVTDVGGVIRYWNPEASRMYGWSVGEAVGRPIAELRLADVPDEVGGQILASMFAGESWSGEFVGRHRDGTTFPVHTSNTPRFDEAGNVVGVIGVATDLTEAKRVEAERAAFERRKEQSRRLESLGLLAGTIAHDFNNLLAPIVAGTDLALELTGPEQVELIDVLRESRVASERASELVALILSYAGRRSFEPVPVDLDTLLLDVVRLQRRTAPAGVELSLALDADRAWVAGQETQLRQVATNLITNAVQAVDGHGRVEISTWSGALDGVALARDGLGADLQAGDHFRVDVVDDGPGMSEETAQRIFEPFFTTRALGTGLGLAAVHGIVRAHGGATRVRSAPGEGTTMSVWLPVIAAPDERPPGTDSTPLPDGPLLAGARVLVVDDDEAVRLTIQKLLVHLGATVTLAEGGTEAMQRLRESGSGFRFVLMDVSMPDLDGTAVVSQLHDRSATPPIVLMTGYRTDDTLSGLPPGSVVDVLQKPISLARLRELAIRFVP